MQLLDLIFPPRCVGCNKVGVYICAHCLGKIKRRELLCPECDRPAIDGLTHPVCLRPQGMEGLVTVFEYHGVMERAIKSIKYRFEYDIAESLVHLIPSTVFHFDASQAVLYPIPLHKDRLKWRGFNQAQKIAQLLSKKFAIPVSAGLLTRTLKRTPQADITKRENRIKNARGLFSLNSQKLPAKIILLDDVWTTGATMKEATKVLKRGGVEKVYGFTIAR